MANDWRKTARARDQLYHYSVLQMRMHNDISTHHRTPELEQLMSTVEAIVKAALHAWETGGIMVVAVDEYYQVTLELDLSDDGEMKSSQTNVES